MPLFVLSSIDKPDSLELRLATRDAHLAFVKARGLIRVGGPFLDGEGRMAGSMSIIEAPDLSAAEAYAADDPYQLAGLFERTDVRAWKVTVGDLI